MDDLVNRLRGRTQKGVTGETALSLHEAADRIEQLERELSLERHKLTESEKVWIATAQKAYDQLAAEKALADRLADSAQVAASYAKGWADADGGLEACEVGFREDYERAIASSAAYRKARGL